MRFLSTNQTVNDAAVQAVQLAADVAVVTAAKADIKSGVVVLTGADAGTYPTTEASKAAQLADDAAEVDAAKAKIQSDVTLLGVAGTLAHRLEVPDLPETVTYTAPVNATAGWTASASTLGIESMHVMDRSPYPQAFAAAPKDCLTLFTSDGSTGSLAYRDVAAMDVSNGFLVGSFYLYPGTAGDADDWLGMLNVQVRLYSDGATDSAHYRTINIYANGGDAGTYQFAGWHHFGVAINDGAAPGASFDPANVTRIALRLANTSAKTPKVAFADLRILPPMAKGIYSCWIDNAYDDAVAMAGYAASLGITVTVSAISSLVGTAGYASLAQLQAMKAAGHVIVNHTSEHASFGGLYSANVAQEYLRCAAWMLANGLADHAAVLSVPGAYLPEAAYNVLIDRCDAIFHGWDTNAARAFVPFGPGRRRLLYASACATDSVDTTTANAALARAIAERCCVITAWHNNWDADNGVAFSAHMDAVAAAIAAGTVVNYHAGDLLTRATLP